MLKISLNASFLLEAVKRVIEGAIPLAIGIATSIAQEISTANWPIIEGLKTKPTIKGYKLLTKPLIIVIRIEKRKLLAILTTPIKYSAFDFVIDQLYK